MKERAEDLLRALGIAQGAWFVFATLGIGTAVAGIAGGILANYATLPWWAVALSMVGAFLIAASLASQIVGRLRPRQTVLATLIDDGLRLRKRLMAEPGETPEIKAAWQTRFHDWIAETRDAVKALAPHRLGAFSLDIIIADYTPSEGAAMWKRNILTEIDLTVERLSVLRRTL